MSKVKHRKPKPQPPKWFWPDTDNCWDCYDRNHCNSCKRLKKIKKYDRAREKRVFRKNKE